MIVLTIDDDEMYSANIYMPDLIVGDARMGRSILAGNTVDDG